MNFFFLRKRKLSLYGLSTVSRLEDANEAQRQHKRHLQSLHLDFSVREQHCQQHMGMVLQPEPVRLSHNQLLESLQPYHSLSELCIWSYESCVTSQIITQPAS